MLFGRVFVTPTSTIGNGLIYGRSCIVLLYCTPASNLFIKIYHSNVSCKTFVRLQNNRCYFLCKVTFVIDILTCPLKHGSAQLGILLAVTNPIGDRAEGCYLSLSIKHVIASYIILF